MIKSQIEFIWGKANLSSYEITQTLKFSHKVSKYLSKVIYCRDDPSTELSTVEMLYVLSGPVGLPTHCATTGWCDECVIACDCTVCRFIRQTPWPMFSNNADHNHPDIYFSSSGHT